MHRDCYPRERGENLEKITAHLAKSIPNVPSQIIDKLQSQLNQNTDSLRSLSTKVSTNSRSVADLCILTDSQTNAILANKEALDTVNAEVASLRELEESNKLNILTTWQTLSTVSTKVDKNSTDIENLSADFAEVGDLSSQVQKLGEQVATNTSGIQQNSADIETLALSTSQNADEIEELRLLIGSGGGGTGSGDSGDTVARLSELEVKVALNESALRPLKIHAESESNVVNIREFSNLEFDIYKNEPFTHNGGKSPDFAVGAKGANMFGVVWARINPRHNSEFAGEVVITLSGVPAGKTTTNLTLTINGESSSFSPTIDPATFEIRLPFSLTASCVCYEFRVDFADSELANSVLDYIRLEVSQGANFSCLNRDNKYAIVTSYSASNKQYLALAKNTGSTQEFVYLYKYYTDDYQRTVYFGVQPFVDSGGTSRYFRHFEGSIEIDYNDAQGEILNGFVWDIVGVERDTLNLIRVNEFSQSTNIIYAGNVYDGSKCYSAEFVKADSPTHDDFISFCGTTYDNEVFICSLNGDNADEKVLLNGEELPAEFIQARPVVDKGYQVVKSLAERAGYILQHRCGELFYLPEKNAEYMIRLGAGKNVNAYVGYAPVPSHNPATSSLPRNVNPEHIRNGEINIYFALLDGSAVVKRVLTQDFASGRFVLKPEIKVFPNLDAVYELDWQRLITVKERTYTIL